jgi:hypothetical protein
MIRHSAQKCIRLVGLVLPLGLCLNSNAFAVDGASTVTEWVTHGESQVVELHQGVRLTLAPDTRIVRQPSVPVPRHLKDLAPRALSVELTNGRLDVDIDTTHQPIYALIVRAPRRVSAFAKGGRCTIVASPQGVVLAALTGSELSGSSADKWRSLRLGTALIVNRESPAGTVRELIKPPMLRASNSLKLSLGASEPTTLSWSSIADAHAYKVTLRREPPNGSTPTRDFEVSQTSFGLPQLDAGQYTVTVSAIDRFSIESAPSNAVSVRVIGIELPKSAYVKNGVPQLGKFQQIHLSQVNGLEMAYGSAALFTPAPESLRLPTGQPLLVRFREPGKTDEVKLMLEPRSIHSTIQFEPKGANWPGQAVKVVVRLFGPDGTDLPESVNVSINTTVNARPVGVHWAHEAHTWQARVEQPPFLGPWILRVTVNDQAGEVLAHDFLEIAMPPGRSDASASLRYSSR